MKNMESDLGTHGDLALVTGAASRLGREIALGLAAQGYAVGVHYHRSASAANETAAAIQNLGVPALTLSADLTEPSEVGALFAAIDSSGYRLKVLVNSAAIMETGNIAELPPEEWDQTMDLNLKGSWLCAQEAAKRMKRFEGSVIINITDSGASKAWTRYPVYVVSKAALESLTRIMARSLAPQIRVNAIAPGLILPSESLSDERWDELVHKVPLKRAGTPQNIVDAVLFLVKNEYITGQTIVVDGGYQLV